MRPAPLVFAGLLLGACAQNQQTGAVDDNGINAYPANYKADILAAMHAYLNDPTGVRDAALSAPLLKPASMSMPARYVACVRFNAKQSGNGYAGVKELAAVFLAGRFDQFIERSKDLCADATYTPFPELENLSR